MKQTDETETFQIILLSFLILVDGLFCFLVICWRCPPLNSDAFAQVTITLIWTLFFNFLFFGFPTCCLFHELLRSIFETFLWHARIALMKGCSLWETGCCVRWAFDVIQHQKACLLLLRKDGMEWNGTEWNGME